MDELEFYQMLTVVFCMSSVIFCSLWRSEPRYRKAWQENKITVINQREEIGRLRDALHDNQ